MAVVGDRSPPAGRDPGVPWEEVPPSVRAAVGRALARQQRDAVDDVEQFLDAALRVSERVAPAEPRIADIIAEAGTSNQTFYRYFAGKQDLLAAVQERGIIRLRAYLSRRMRKHEDVEGQVSAWVEGLLAQVTSPSTARQGAAVTQQLANSGRRSAEDALVDQLGELLVPVLSEAGNPEPALEARALQDVVLGAIGRHAMAGTAPDANERAYLLAFARKHVGEGRR